jgi:hypothetical protein
MSGELPPPIGINCRHVKSFEYTAGKNSRRRKNV